MRENIVVVGFGLAGRDHVKALEQVPGATVVAIVDPEVSRAVTFLERHVPVYPTVLDAKSHHHADLVVVASPTPTHARVCDEVTEHFPAAELLVEKPVADNLIDARRLILGKQAVTVAFHMAYSPEVLWALDVARNRATDLGRPVAIQSISADPYYVELKSATSRLGSSWIDTGINALSVIDRFATPTKRKSLRQIGTASWSAFEGTFSCIADGTELDAVVVTSWYATDRSRTTRIRYDSGAELVMEHNSVQGYLFENSTLSDYFGTPGQIPRRESHYRELYKTWLTDQDEAFPSTSSIRLHELLLGT